MIKNKSLLAAVMAAHRNGGALSSRRMSFVDLAVLHVWRGAGGGRDQARAAPGLRVRQAGCGAGLRERRLSAAGEARSMTPYHGTPIGGSRQDAARFLIGRNALVPYPRQDDIGIVADVCQRFVLDNGAFSVWKRGEVLDVAGYTAWTESLHRHPGFEWALIPDVIDGGEPDNDAMLRDWPTSLRHVGVPVWHMHESIGRLQRLCREWRTVALGSSGQWSSPGTAGWWTRMTEAMNAICDERGRPMARLHGLRMLDPAIFQHLPLTSADSTNAAVNCGSLERFGMYVAPTSSQRAAVIAERIEHCNGAAVWRARETQPDFFGTAA